MKISFKSKLFMDSFWSVFGNGIGYGLLLLSGIIIARILGKDLYGEYGAVKNTMLYLGAFAAFGLGSTTTKYISVDLQKDNSYVHSIITNSIVLSLAFSIIVSVALACFSDTLAVLANVPQLGTLFRYIGVLIIFRALLLTSIGLLSGFKEFKPIGIYHIVSGLIMLAICYPLTKLLGLRGGLLSLVFYQIALASLSIIKCYTIGKRYPHEKSVSKLKLVKFSFPVMLQEFVANIWAIIMMFIITKYASTGEFGIYNAAIQWNGVIVFIPSVLVNVVLSYLSSSTKSAQHGKMLKKLLLVNFLCSIIPFLIVCCLASFISSLYGPSFIGLREVLVICILSTVFIGVTNVYQSDLISQNRVWSLLLVRLICTSVMIFVAYGFISRSNGEHAALIAAYVTLASTIFSFVLMMVASRFKLQEK